MDDETGNLLISALSQSVGSAYDTATKDPLTQILQPQIHLYLSLRHKLAGHS